MARIDLTTLARVKAHTKNVQSTALDGLISGLITTYSRLAERQLGLHSKQEARTEQYDIRPRQDTVFLRGMPVDTTKTLTVINSSDRNFAAGVEIDGDLFFVQADRGKLRFDVDLVPGPGVLQVVYTGGLGGTTASAVTEFPEIATGIDIQVGYIILRRDQYNVASMSMEGGSVSFQSTAKFIPEAWQLLKPFRREWLM